MVDCIESFSLGGVTAAFLGGEHQAESSTDKFG